MGWSEGYVSSIRYFHGYSREISPFFQDYVLATLRQVSPQAAKPRCLELGFGKGVAMHVHAAAQGLEYWGTDFIPGQAAEALEIEESCGNGLQIFDQSFAEFAARKDLPTFDYIGLNGVWAWVSAENRACLTELLKRILKPGGIFYVSYNTDPGWGGRHTVRDLLALYAEFGTPAGLDVLARFRKSYEFVNQLADAGCPYMEANPEVKKWLQGLEDQDPVYLAHEYLNEHWVPQSFASVQKELDAAKLTFSGSADMIENLDQINFPEETLKMLSRYQDPVLNQMVRDFCVNRIYRRDLFVRGPRSLNAHDARATLERFRFVLLSKEVSLRLTRARGSVVLNPEAYSPLVKFMGEKLGRPYSIAELAKGLKKEGIGPDRLHQMLAILVGARVVAPAQDEVKIEAAEAGSARLNKSLFERAAWGAGINLLASPVTGGGIPVDQITQRCLHAYDNGYKKAADAAPFLWKFLSQQGKKMVTQGVTAESDEENKKALRATYQGFLKDKLPFLQRLKVV